MALLEFADADFDLVFDDDVVVGVVVVVGVEHGVLEVLDVLLVLVLPGQHVVLVVGHGLRDRELDEHDERLADEELHHHLLGVGEDRLPLGVRLAVSLLHVAPLLQVQREVHCDREDAHDLEDGQPDPDPAFAAAVPAHAELTLLDQVHADLGAVHAPRDEEADWPGASEGQHHAHRQHDLELVEDDVVHVVLAGVHVQEGVGVVGLLVDCSGFLRNPLECIGRAEFDHIHSQEGHDLNDNLLLQVLQATLLHDAVEEFDLSAGLDDHALLDECDLLGGEEGNDLVEDEGFHGQIVELELPLLVVLAFVGLERDLEVDSAENLDAD
mmetsp:Transcript_95528/g.206124  ORF Transcript_95528/g.206124 Transcript_95528/m.206124 type:complete len:326 (+) Transcript_95528:253-1230(+)